MRRGLKCVFIYVKVWSSWDDPLQLTVDVQTAVDVQIQLPADVHKTSYNLS